MFNDDLGTYTVDYTDGKCRVHFTNYPGCSINWTDFTYTFSTILSGSDPIEECIERNIRIEEDETAEFKKEDFLGSKNRYQPQLSSIYAGLGIPKTFIKEKNKE